MDQCFEYCDSYSQLTKKAIFHPECTLIFDFSYWTQSKIVALQKVSI